MDVEAHLDLAATHATTHASGLSFSCCFVTAAADSATAAVVVDLTAASGSSFYCFSVTTETAAAAA